jgi:hypothetical protein
MIMARTALRGIEVPSLRNLSAISGEGEDLLNLVPEDHAADLRSTRQVDFMESLISQLTDLDEQTGRQAREFTDKTTERGSWTPGRNGNASDWISRMLAKLDQLRAATRPVSPGPIPTIKIPAGRYAIETDEIRCYSIEYGREGTRWEGFLFLNRISSDDRFPIKNHAEKDRILSAIAADVEGAAILAGLTLRQCRRCGRTLSDTKNPFFSVALGPECGTK